MRSATLIVCALALLVALGASAAQAATSTVDQIKADPNVVNWAWWDNAMTSPPFDTDY